MHLSAETARRSNHAVISIVLSVSVCGRTERHTRQKKSFVYKCIPFTFL